ALAVLDHVVAPSVLADLPLEWRRGRGEPSARAGFLADDLDAHAAGRALDDLHAGLDVVDVEVGQLGLGDLADLVARDAAHGLAPRRGGALVDARGLAQEVRRRRCLEDER